MRPYTSGVATAVVASALVAGCTHPSHPGAPSPSAHAPPEAPSAPPVVASVSAPATVPSGPLRFVAVGGGATPESTEISLEQDIDLVASTLPPPGTVLFAGGAGSLSVREEDPKPHGDELLLAVGALFHPRNGRQSRYAPVRLDAARASIDGVETALDMALSSGQGPLLLYVAAHGDQGDAPRDNLVALWGGQPLTVAHLAEVHERHERPLRLVVTSCFSGGFGELAFAHADERRGPSKVPRCGVFAGTWDRETSGCDPNPDRKAQESYGLHFIHALAGKDRDGHPLPSEAVDFDHDGAIGLLDAHTRARIAAMSLDVPTTTSERYLRSVEHGSAPIDGKLLPEDAAVVAELGKALGLPDEAAVEKRWTALDARMNRLDDALADAQAALSVKEATLGSRLLERWPVLDDAFHPDFAGMLGKNRNAITDVLEHSPEAAARAKAREDVDDADGELAGLEVEEARLLRLRRAYETLHLASALVHRGGAAARYYTALLACERGAP
ncbi:MAG TPA: hypothetical protein VH062_27510 [Polyangiaceae bacterium]|nr:hypothetical protein [Polyangiaceae bacterium]